MSSENVSFSRSRSLFRRLICCSIATSPEYPYQIGEVMTSNQRESPFVSYSLHERNSLLLNVAHQSFPSRLRKLSQAFFSGQVGDKIDLMNDWEIGGTHNRWVCPSDRHLQLRAQLKSGWSVRTAIVRSPTNAKQQNGNITEAEQEHIKAVLAKAEAGKAREQMRIGKMVDRLERLRGRATGNGVTQCSLCCTDFGLLASKSYAAMCFLCRKYVCQKNCGVETYDNARRCNIFLCKICSEYREVMWKKSGAWFYKELPEYTKPCETSEVRSPPYNSKTWQHHTKSSSTNASVQRNRFPSNSHDPNSSGPQRPRILPSWVKEKIQTSLSICSDEENASTSEEDEEEMVFKEEGSKTNSETIRRNRTQRYGSNVRPPVQRFSMGRSRIIDTDESGESQHTTPSLSPQRSPSSYGDDLSLNPSSIVASDAKSVDSGVVPSDHSAPVNVQAIIDRSLPSSNESPMRCLPTREVYSASRLISVVPSTSFQFAHNSSELKLGTAQPQSFIEPLEDLMIASTAEPPPIPPRKYSLLFNRSLSVSPDPSITGNIKPDEYGSKSGLTKEVEQKCVMESTPEEEPKSTAIFKKSHSPLWQKKKKCVVDRVVSDSISTTQSTQSLQLKFIKDETAPIRRIASGNEMKILDDDNSGCLGSLEFSLTYLPNEKQLKIKLIRAKNLKAMDKNGFSDPYVKLHLIPGATKATKLTSKTIEKTLNPEWNEEFVYHGISEDDRNKKTLRLTVLDRDRIGSDFLGETRIPLKKLLVGQRKDFNLYLERAIPVEKSDESVERGKILLGLVYNVQQGSLFVTIKRCAELVGLDPTGFSDPYVKVALAPVISKSHRQKTTIKKRTLNPEFNETLAFIVPFKDLPKKVLQVAVYDHDVGKYDDYIGGVILSTSAKGDRQEQWMYCTQNPGSSSEYWHKLELGE